MKFRTILLSLACLVLLACNQEEMNSIKDHSASIATIEQQIDGITSTLELLKQADKRLDDQIKALHPEDYATKDQLSAMKAALETSISDLENYVKTELTDTKDWVQATFATLAQYQKLCEDLALLEESLNALETKFSSSLGGAISSLEESLKTWISEQLDGYYTIAQIDAKLSSLLQNIQSGDETISSEVNQLKLDLQQRAADLTTAYQNAIATAIQENNGIISQQISTAIQTAMEAIQSQIESITTRCDALETRIKALESAVASLIESVQSIVVVPDYDDGSVKMTSLESNPVRFEVYPLETARKLVEAGTSAFSLDCVETETKASIFLNIPIKSVSFDGEIITVTVYGAEISEFVRAGIYSANARLRISNETVTRTSSFFHLVFDNEQEEDDTIILPETVGTDKLTALSVQLNGKVKYPNTYASNHVIGFQYSKSAGILPANSTFVEVSDADAVYNFSTEINGLDPESTYYYRAIVRREGQDTYGQTMSFTTLSLDTIFETLDASDIKPTSAVLNAKLDLTNIQHTSKAYGFYWGSAEGAMNNCLYGASITDNAFNAIISNLPHNTQYWYKAFLTIDGRTFYGIIKSLTTDVVKVESVSLNIDEYTFHTIGNTLSLKATVLPLDATNKALIWESDNESVATVDENGLVKAEGNGKAIITVTSKDQGKKASCTIYVEQYVTGITLSESTIFLLPEEKTTIHVTAITPENAYNKVLKWSSSDLSVASVDETGNVSSWANGKVTITASADDGSGITASCLVYVTSSSLEENYIDLGLSVRWAKCNLGAMVPEEFGDYYAWGETQPKSIYDWSTYIYVDGEYHFTKYVTGSSYGDVDNKTQLDLFDDAAYKNLGTPCRMPSKKDWQELYSNCKWEKTTLNGVNGVMITSKIAGYTDQSIFIPYAGRKSGSALFEVGVYGSYLSSTLNDSNNCVFINISGSSPNVNIGFCDRIGGRSIRPVAEKY